MKEEDFEKAVQNPDYRAEFVRGIDLEDTAQFVENVTYTPLLSREGMACYGPHTFFRKKPSITVFPLAFHKKIAPTFPDFKSLLIDHEGYHAKTSATRPPSKNPWGEFYFKWHDLISQGKKPPLIKVAKSLREYYLEEIKAYENQLSNATKRGISNEFKQLIVQLQAPYKQTINSLEEVIRFPVTFTTLVDLLVKMRNSGL